MKIPAPSLVADRAGRASLVVRAASPSPATDRVPLGLAAGAAHRRRPCGARHAGAKQLHRRPAVARRGTVRRRHPAVDRGRSDGPTLRRAHVLLIRAVALSNVKGSTPPNSQGLAPTAATLTLAAPRLCSSPVNTPKPSPCWPTCRFACRPPWLPACRPPATPRWPRCCCWPAPIRPSRRVSGGWPAPTPALCSCTIRTAIPRPRWPPRPRAGARRPVRAARGPPRGGRPLEGGAEVVRQTLRIDPTYPEPPPFLSASTRLARRRAVTKAKAAAARAKATAGTPTITPPAPVAPRPAPQPPPP